MNNSYNESYIPAYAENEGYDSPIPIPPKQMTHNLLCQSLVQYVNILRMIGYD